MATTRPAILIVEDEPGIADTLQYALSTDGFEPHWVTSGEAALARVAQHEPALVIMDLGLPDIHGFDLYKQLRRTSEVPVLFLTARSAEIDRVVGLELGADDYVTKPFSPRELVARVRTVLRRTSRASVGTGVVTGVVTGAGAHAGTASTGATGQPQHADSSEPPPAPPRAATRTPFDIDEGRRAIRYYGQLLDLSRYEYGLLKTLMARPGIVFTRDQLLALVWDNGSDSFDRTVDAHVKTLRAKLRAVAPELDAIRTHRGTGYALAEDLPAALPSV
jgi:two-component system, OmpR family, catabolic regulation response regulator CreB